jgi:hypothetical protein
MATLKEYFLKDFANALTVDFNWEIVPPPEGDINVKVGVEINSSAEFVAYYVPQHPHHSQIFEHLINSWPEAIKRSKDVGIITGEAYDFASGEINML